MLARVLAERDAVACRRRVLAVVVAQVAARLYGWANGCYVSWILLRENCFLGTPSQEGYGGLSVPARLWDALVEPIICIIVIVSCTEIALAYCMRRQSSRAHLPSADVRPCE